MSIKGIYSPSLQSLVYYLGEGDKEVVEAGAEAGAGDKWWSGRDLEQGGGGHEHRP